MKVHLTITLLLLELCAFALAQDSYSKVRDPHPLTEIDKRKFTVELTVHASPSSVESVKHQQKDFLEDIKTLDIPQYIVLRQYVLAWNAITFEIDINSGLDKVYKEDLHKIAELPEVKAIFPEQKHHPLHVSNKLGKRQNSSDASALAQHYNGYAADPLSAHRLTGVQTIHKTTKLAGNGIKVGIIDTGVDYRHPALGGCFGPGCRVAYGYDFVGEDGKTPDPDPLDTCFGHGTHCAGIIGGRDPDGPWVGVAYNVTFGAYRIFTCGQFTSDSILISAIEKAVEDGMDIISLSLGGWGWPESATAAAASNTAEHINVIIAIGNEGLQGIWTADDPGVGYETIAVASVNNLVVSEFYFTPDVDPSHLIPFEMSPNVSKSAFDNTAIPLLDLSPECPPTSDKVIDVSGKILLIDLSRCTGSNYPNFSSDALGFLYYTANQETVNPGEQMISDGAPAFLIRNDDGIWLATTVKAHPNLKLVSSQKEKSFDMPDAGKPSDFSSYGISPDLDLKPDVSAPGAQILSTFPLDLGGWAQDSGTSMATPYVAGVVALLLEKYGKISPNTVRSLLLNTAIPIRNHDGKIYPVPKQGSGLINVVDALKVQTVLTPTKYALNNGSLLAIPKAQTLSILNLASTPVKYSISHLPAISFSGYNNSSPSPLTVVIPSDATAEIHFSETVVTVPGHGKAVITWNIKPPKLDPNSHWFYSGFIKVTPHSGEHPQTIPYIGALTSGLIDVLQQENGYPLFNYLNSSDPNGIVSITLFDDNPTRLLVAGVQTANNKTNLGYFFNSPYMPRSQVPTNITFAGLIGVGNPDPSTGAYDNSTQIPDGNYRIFVKAVKLFGNIKRIHDYEEWVSSPFTVKLAPPS